MEIVTISRNKITGDRSYCNGVWQITGRNESHVSVYPLMDCGWSWQERRKHFFLADEHDFCDARSLLSQEEFNHCLAMGLVGI